MRFTIVFTSISAFSYCKKIISYAAAVVVQSVKRPESIPQRRRCHWTDLSLIPGCSIGGWKNPSRAIYEANMEVSAKLRKQMKKEKNNNFNFVPKSWDVSFTVCWNVLILCVLSFTAFYDKQSNLLALCYFQLYPGCYKKYRLSWKKNLLPIKKIHFYEGAKIWSAGTPFNASQSAADGQFLQRRKLWRNSDGVRRRQKLKMKKLGWHNNNWFEIIFCIAI